jgi:hypothetical protein
MAADKLATAVFTEVILFADIRGTFYLTNPQKSPKFEQ